MIADWVPVVYVTLMASSSIKEINALILLYLGYPPEGLARTTTTRVLHALADARRAGRDPGRRPHAPVHQRQGRAVLDYIKFLNTELGEINNGTVILVGANLESTAILDDPQIRARLTTMTVDAFQISTIENKAAWQDLLATAADGPCSTCPTPPRTCSSPSWPNTSGDGPKASSARSPNSSPALSWTPSTTGAASSPTTTSTRSSSANARSTANSTRPRARSAVMTRALPVRPVPATGEPLTSYAARLADANGLTRSRVLPATATTSAFPPASSTPSPPSPGWTQRPRRS
jgi:hypothetical protein